MKGVNYSDIHSQACIVIQKLQDMVQQQEKRIQELELKVSKQV